MASNTVSASAATIRSVVASTCAIDFLQDMSSQGAQGVGASQSPPRPAPQIGSPELIGRVTEDVAHTIKETLVLFCGSVPPRRCHALGEPRTGLRTQPGRRRAVRRGGGDHPYLRHTG